MPNDVLSRQNEPDALDLLCASRQVYADAKWMGTCQLLLSTSAAVLGPVLTAFVPEAKAWVGLYGGSCSW